MFIRKETQAKPGKEEIFECRRSTGIKGFTGLSVYEWKTLPRFQYLWSMSSARYAL